LSKSQIVIRTKKTRTNLSGFWGHRLPANKNKKPTFSWAFNYSCWLWSCRCFRNRE